MGDAVSVDEVVEDIEKRVYLRPLPAPAQRVLKGLPKSNGDDRVLSSLPVHQNAGGQPTFFGNDLRNREVAKTVQNLSATGQDSFCG